MFHYLYYSVTINESNKTFELFFGYFSGIKNIDVPSSSNFPVKLFCRGMFVFACLDKPIPMSV